MLIDVSKYPVRVTPETCPGAVVIRTVEGKTSLGTVSYEVSKTGGDKEESTKPLPPTVKCPAPGGMCAFETVIPFSLMTTTKMVTRILNAEDIYRSETPSTLEFGSLLSPDAYVDQRRETLQNLFRARRVSGEYGDWESVPHVSDTLFTAISICKDAFTGAVSSHSVGIQIRVKDKLVILYDKNLTPLAAFSTGRLLLDTRDVHCPLLRTIHKGADNIYARLVDDD